METETASKTRTVAGFSTFRWHVADSGIRGPEVNVLQELRYSARSLARAPGMSLALVLSIAFGIGSNAAVYGFVRGLIADELPVAEMNGLVSVVALDARRAAGPISYDDVLALERRGDVFTWLGGARELQSGVSLENGAAVMSVPTVTPEIMRDRQRRKGSVRLTLPFEVQFWPCFPQAVVPAHVVVSGPPGSPRLRSSCWGKSQKHPRKR
jgi:hypothetical protein